MILVPKKLKEFYSVRKKYVIFNNLDGKKTTKSRYSLPDTTADGNNIFALIHCITQKI